MSTETMKFVVVEDKDEDREEVLTRLAHAGFSPQNKVGSPGTYQDALELLSAEPQDIDVVFLDLNLPRDDRDTRPEKGHGNSLLQFIHDDLNTRPGVHIRVIVVSGEDLLDGVTDANMMRAFPGTLVSVANKAVLDKTLKTSLKRLKRDPLLSALRRTGLDVIDEYVCVVDGTQPIRERLEAARRLAIHLVRCESDHYRNQSGITANYADDLNGLIKDFIESRFSPNEQGRRHIRASKIESKGGWGAFLWRGAMVQHLYAINSYRNLYTHINEQPYEAAGFGQASWEPSADVLEDAKRGKAVGEILALTVRDLLRWYLPWYEQVYRPWLESGA